MAARSLSVRTTALVLALSVMSIPGEALPARPAPIAADMLPPPPSNTESDASMKLPMTAQVDAPDVLRQVQMIDTPFGISETRKLRVNGTDQWISIRGKDRRNPVLLVVHGGPGFTMMPASWTWQPAFEDFFTVVQWDQRGSGKSFASNDRDAVASTMNVTSFVSDGISVIQQLQAILAQKQILLMGNSWGSVIGLRIAHSRPDLLLGYIGAGQAVDARQSFSATAIEVEALARKAGDIAVADALASINRDPEAQRRNAGIINRYARFYGGMIFRPNARDADLLSVTYRNMVRLSPSYTPEDKSLWLEGIKFSLAHLDPSTDGEQEKAAGTLAIPLLVLVGDHDLITNHQVAITWYDTVKAPSKALAHLPNSAHLLFSEEPGRVLLALLKFARPILRDKPQYHEWGGFDR